MEKAGSFVGINSFKYILLNHMGGNWIVLTLIFVFFGVFSSDYNCRLIMPDYKLLI